MIPFLRTIVVFCVITLGAGLGADFYQEAQGGELRTPGEAGNHHVLLVHRACRLLTINPDRCALLNGITI